MAKENKAALARRLGVSRALLYYTPKQAQKDWVTKQSIEAVLHEYPAYGHKRLALHLKINKKRVLRVMKLFGIQPYRRKAKKWHKGKEKPEIIYPNLLLSLYPLYPGHIWASDFTHVVWRGVNVFIATLIDLYTREIVGWTVLLHHRTELVLNALLSAVNHRPPPGVLHSDEGSEYTSREYTTVAINLGITLSMSRPGSPWENGYQESFYGKFKVDLGDTDRFETLGELVYEIHRTIHRYNNNRIHTALRMPPAIFAEKWSAAQSGKKTPYPLEKVSNEMGT